MIKQYVARHSFTRGAAQAVRLNAARAIAPCVLNTTVALKPEQVARGSVQLRRATAAFQRGNLIIQAGEAFYFVESSYPASCCIKKAGRSVRTDRPACLQAVMFPRREYGV